MTRHNKKIWTGFVIMVFLFSSLSACGRDTLNSEKEAQKILGDKDLQEVTEIIQNRVQLILDE